MVRVPVAALGLVLATLAGPALGQQAYDSPSQNYGRAALSGHSVADIQRALADAGYRPGPADGVIGPSTRDAIADFQRDMGLRISGEADPRTISALERRGLLASGGGAGTFDRSPRQTVDTRGDTREWGTPDAAPAGGAWTGTPREVVELQRALSDAGYYRGPLNGTLDATTRYAVANLQDDLGLSPTGMPGQAVVDALRERGLMEQAAAPAQPQDTGAQEGEADPALVADVQSALRAQGYDIPAIDGNVDSETRSAIRSFQRRQGLPATGQASPELLALIETGARDPSAMTDREVIREIQVRLHNRGHTVGTINGRMDDRTSQAIAEYQQERGLQPTGRPSRDLLADLKQTADTAQTQAEVPPQEAQPQDIFRMLGERALEGLSGGGEEAGQGGAAGGQ